MSVLILYQSDDGRVEGFTFCKTSDEKNKHIRLIQPQRNNKITYYQQKYKK